ncbi:MAG: homocysteine S-methyltransferase [Planctomycetes bacterium]|nr:homocysteine S-methyltransferase [Planctomycetota bacterium]
MKDPAELIKRFKSRVHVLDGGLATELEKRGHDISGKLWSAQVLLEDPGAIEQLHYDYLKAGADIIITSSYQLTFQGMKEAGYTHEQAEDALWKSVEVAVKARDRYLSDLKEDLPEDRRPLIAASIGPYGAYLADGSEYRGKYGQSCEELERFHRERFDLLIRSEADLLAFETSPEEDEVNAYFSLLETPEVSGWITTSTSKAATAAMNFYDVIPSKGIVALGANCVGPSSISEFINQYDWVNDHTAIIVYPNSGEGWDAEHRCWVGENDAEHFAGHAREWIKAGANIIGGCCRTGPEHIAQLRALVDSLSPRSP